MRKTEEEAKLQREKINTSTWLQGYYFYIAVCSAFGEDTQYPDKPIELKGKTKLEKSKEVENKIKQQLLNAKLLLEQRREKKG